MKRLAESIEPIKDEEIILNEEQRAAMEKVFAALTPVRRKRFDVKFLHSHRVIADVMLKHNIPKISLIGMFQNLNDLDMYRDVIHDGLAKKDPPLPDETRLKLVELGMKHLLVHSKITADINIIVEAIRRDERPMPSTPVNAGPPDLSQSVTINLGGAPDRVDIIQREKPIEIAGQKAISEEGIEP